MEKILKITALFSLILFFQCAGAGKAASGSSAGVKASDDLSQTRPSYEVTMPTDTMKTQQIVKEGPDKTVDNDVTSQVDDTIESINRESRDADYINGFTIQVYSGRSREKANELKNEVYKAVSDYTPKITFDEPNFKVFVGQFYDKIEAHELESKLKATIPTAIIVPTRIKLK
ncbi:SPOR domain-containing protein [Mangrovivirga cuniculi]|uniref:SPOR domain-containing protein n=1 Tax=Mangrovivirga cuniculi TaxID=2715131 RepID=A0A4D7JBG1_9BACT|nr:SPOR domain-containing protein [Mangrovivirga cuniculi]QCK13719.1 hypothetical protein DCC35_02590 [Mangrovivirga cuniculi]